MHPDHSVTFDGQKFMNGYLIKTWSLQSVELDEVHPTFSELQRFQSKGDGDGGDVSLRGLSEIKRNIKFMKGDSVTVVEGNLKKLMGVVQSVDGDQVTIMPTNVALNETVKVLDSTLRKSFSPGDHVKVMTGQHLGETGMVLKVDGSVVVMHSDSTKQEVKLLSQDIQITTEVSSGKMSMGGYELLDLVQITPSKAGVIVKVETEGFQVLTNEDVVEFIRLPEIRRKLMDGNTFAYDHNHRPLSINDPVNIVDGKFANRSGVIKHIYRDVLFLIMQDRVDNAGIICVRTNQCLVQGESRSSDSGRVIARGRVQRGRVSARGGGRGRGRGGGRDPLLNQTVRVKQGPFKNHLGVVKLVNDNTLRLELLSRNKIVTISRSQITEDGVPGSSRRDIDISSGLRTPLQPQTPIATPFRPSTPLYMPGTPRSAPGTPLHAPDTPMQNSVWDPQSVATPARSADTPNIDSEYHHTPRSYDAASPATFAQPATFSASETPNSLSHLRTPFASDAPPTYSEGAPTPYSGGSDQIADTPRIPGTPGGDLYLATPGGAKDWRSSTSSSSRPTNNWVAGGLCVTITSDFAGGRYAEKTGVIQRVTDSMCTVSLDDNPSDVQSVPSEMLRPVQPVPKDRVMLINGESDSKFQKGELMAFDGDERIVKLENLQIKIVHLSFICKYRPH